jgi:hypothetical protein
MSTSCKMQLQCYFRQAATSLIHNNELIVMHNQDSYYRKAGAAVAHKL